MHAIEQQLADRNLQTAWALAGSWSADHQDRLAELVVDRFIRQPQEEPCTNPSH